MCGFFGITCAGQRPDLGRILVKAARRLIYRGYDSVGAAVVDEAGAITLRKDAGKVEEVNRRLDLESLQGVRGIVQLRWATFGVPNRANAQPHLGCDTGLVGAHNGNIINTIALRDELRGRGHEFRGENDGEVLVHAIEDCYAPGGPGDDLERAVRAGCRTLKGDYACCVTDQKNNRLITVKMGSSLYLGVGENFTCCSSDLPSILEFTREIVPVQDGEYAVLTPDSYRLRRLADGSEVARATRHSDLSIEAASRGGFPHFMQKEIHQQPDKLKALLDYLDEAPQLEELLDLLERAPMRFLVGAGTSYHACVVGSGFFNQLAGLPAIPVMAGSFIDTFGESLGIQDALVCVSQSGETKDLINVVNYAGLHRKGQLVGLVNVMGSTLHMRARHHLPLACDLEVSVPATKTFVNQLLLLYVLALRLGERRGRPNQEYRAGLKGLPELVSATIEMVDQDCRELAGNLARVEEYYCLGYGINYGIALEGALKIKEVTYHHCEGMHSSEFKHGPLSAVGEGYPVLFATAPRDAGMVISHMNEVACRGGDVVVFSPPDHDLATNAGRLVAVPQAPYLLTPFLNVVPLQLLAYHISTTLGLDPDFPRNISKTLTVD